MRWLLVALLSSVGDSMASNEVAIKHCHSVQIRPVDPAKGRGPVNL